MILSETGGIIIKIQPLYIYYRYFNQEIFNADLKKLHFHLYITPWSSNECILKRGVYIVTGPLPTKNQTHEIFSIHEITSDTCSSQITDAASSQMICAASSQITDATSQMTDAASSQMIMLLLK